MRCLGTFFGSPFNYYKKNLSIPRKEGEL